MGSYRGAAIVIGIEKYTYLAHPSNTLNDSRAIKCMLLDYGFDVIYMENPNKKDVHDGFNILSKMVSKCNYHEVIIYYAGHGFSNGNAHFMVLSEFKNPNTAPTYELIDHCISVEMMVNIVQSIRPEILGIRAIAVILDCCRDFVPYIDRSKNNHISLNLVLPRRTRYELSYDARTGVLTTYACERGRGAQCGKPGRNGVYTGHLLKQLIIPEISIIYALGKVHQLVVEETESAQIPEMNVNFPHFFMFSLNKGFQKTKSLPSLNDLAIKWSIPYQRVTQIAPVIGSYFPLTHPCRATKAPIFRSWLMSQSDVFLRMGNLVSPKRPAKMVFTILGKNFRHFSNKHRKTLQNEISIEHPKVFALGKKWY